MDFRPVFIAFALRRLDTVLNVDKQIDAAAICAGSFRSAGAFALYAFPLWLPLYSLRRGF